MANSQIATNLRADRPPRGLAPLVTLCVILALGCADGSFPAEEGADAGTPRDGARDAAPDGFEPCGDERPCPPPPDDGGPGPNAVRVLRDDRGVPHVEAGSFEAALYGLGWVHAEDRLFQMSLRRWRMQGRLAEHFAIESPDTAADRAFNQRLVRDDRRVRTMGFARSAERSAARLSEEHRRLLEAYAAGVNAQVAARDGLGTAFDEARIGSVEPWTVADALLAWDAITYVFGGPFGSISSEVDTMRACASGTCPAPSCNDTVLDEEAAVVPPPEDGMWPPGPGGHTACRLPGTARRPDVNVKASQGFVVSGELLTGGKPLIFGEPQLALEAPSTWYEHHILVPPEGIDVRGAGFAGAPGVLLYWNRHTAQTATAGGGDLADLFTIQPGRTPGTYVVDGREEPFETVEERILVRGGTPVDLAIEVTRYGPVVDGILDDVPAGRKLAMRWAEDVRPETHSVVGGIELMRAHTLEAYRDALRHWVGPTISAMYAGVDADDGESHIAYHSLVGIADRAELVIGGLDLTGRHPYDGSDSSQDWDGILDLSWNPHVIDPSEGYLFNGNHLPVGSWYDDYVYSGIRGNGDTYRSMELRLRLRDLLATGEPVDAEQLHALHVDSRSEVALTVRDVLAEMQSRGTIPPDDPDTTPRTPEAVAARVLTALERWKREGGGVLDQRVAGSRLAAAVLGRMTTAARAEPFSCTWGAAQGGFAHFLKAFRNDPTVLGREEEAVVLSGVQAAWADVVVELGPDVRSWTGTDPPRDFVVGYQRNFYCLRPAQAGGCSLSEAHERPATIARNFTNTISSPHGSSWPFTVDFADVDGAFSLLAPGVSEEPTSPRFFDTIEHIEAKGRGESDSIPRAPLDLSRIAVSDELRLTYSP